MFEPPDHYYILSQRLSEVLSDIGVNQKEVIKRRQTYMLSENLIDIYHRFNRKNITILTVGSLSEGSTTEGLNSDMDILYCYHDFRVIQNWSNWEPGIIHFRIVQDDSTPPGYCLLQIVDPFKPLPMKNVYLEHVGTDSRGRFLLKHSMLIEEMLPPAVRHGPAMTLNGTFGASDHVQAFHCTSWPKEAEAWLQKQNASGWPTEDMKRYSAEQGCFVVPVASKTSVNQDLEWRISTSLAERCLMWNLNITQLRCYILMKMVIKTFLEPNFGEVVSSFICKNILFHSIADSRSKNEWHESSLATWFNHCLRTLFNCILSENCPHFIIPRNKLLAGALTAELKHKLEDVLCSLTRNVEQTLLRIVTDGIGHRLYVKSFGKPIAHLKFADDIIAAKMANGNISWLPHVFFIIKDTWEKLPVSGNVLFSYQILEKRVSELYHYYLTGNRAEQVASFVVTPFFCISLGSIKASLDIQTSNAVSSKAITWFNLGLNSDAAVSRLKLASALFSARNPKACAVILADVEKQVLKRTVLRKCFCYPSEIKQNGFNKLLLEKNENSDVTQYNMAFCVTYLPCEIICIPKELKYEMFRSTEEDRTHRSVQYDWMDWAVVDSLSYVHFLQYKVNSHLQRPSDKERALYKLAQTINIDSDLGHRETALNLLGQCMEQENRTKAALCCYAVSLSIRKVNNAANWHVCKMLSRQFRQQF